MILKILIISIKRFLKAKKKIDNKKVKDKIKFNKTEILLKIKNLNILVKSQNLTKLKKFKKCKSQEIRFYKDSFF